ncbi:MAG TPA: Rne/Rng family ribonuclease [Syntrophales bacterium]|nr:Rne/Rng family ribonuclease [Syntrophales bacterium]
MKQEMLVNAVHPEQKRMANVEDGKLVEFNIQMSYKQPITGNIYKGIVLKVERGLQAAFVSFGGKKDGFLPLRDVGQEYFSEQNGKDGGQGTGRHFLKVGQELLVQVLREVSGQKGALLTSYISIPGRYLVLLPNKQSSGVSRKIEDEADRKRLKEIVEQIQKEDEIGFIVRTAGMNRTKQELSRDYQHLLRLWQEIQKKAKTVPAPSLIFQESDFGVTTLRDYFTPEITEILVDDPETFRIMRAYCKAVAPRNLNMIKLYKEKTPIFDKYQLEDQIRTIYQERVNLKSGGYVVIKPTEAMITIDVNSGKGSNKRNIEETAFRTNTDAAEEIARQLRLRDLGGLIAIDFIDMMDRKNIANVEKTFKKALSIDRARIQLARISKFGILELSRQKKRSTIQEISYTSCPFCHGSGIRPSLEYTALSAFRKIESQAVKGAYSCLNASLPNEVATYLLNQKRSEIGKLETTYDMAIHIASVPDMAWDEVTIEATGRKPLGEAPTETAAEELTAEISADDGEETPEYVPVDESVEDHKKKPHRRRSRHKKSHTLPVATPEVISDPVSLPLDGGGMGGGDFHHSVVSTPGMEVIPETAPEAALPPSDKATPVTEEGVQNAADLPVEPKKAKRYSYPWRRKKKEAQETPSPAGESEDRNDDLPKNPDA